MARITFVPILMTLIGSAVASIQAFIQTDNLVEFSSSPLPALSKALLIQDYSFDVGVSVVLSGQQAAGRPVLSKFSFTRPVDGNSPIFFTDLVQPKTLTQFVLTIVEPTQPAFISTVYTFSPIVINGQTVSNDANGVPTENVTFVYGKVAVTHTQRNSDGTDGQVTSGSYNSLANTVRSVPFEA